MSVVCPHCQAPVDAPATTEGEIRCTACGSSFRFEHDITADWKPSDHQRTLGKFELIDLVGSGAFGSVYKAHDTELGRTVAIKVPRASDLGSSGGSDRFLREARSVAQLRHPSIVPVFEIGQDGGLPYLVSEFVHGITLADLLTSERLPARTAAELVAQIADGLHYAHEQGVIHRDVKPSNIMLEMPREEAPPADKTAPRYVPRLMDFGLAKRDTGEITMTVEGQVLGTPAYMSPEQARGDSHSVDRRSDVYSLGVVLYQLLTGELPFQGNTRMLLHHVLHDEPKPPRQRDAKIPRDVETICLKAMAKEPARRYTSAGEFSADLKRFLNDEPILARPVGLREKLYRRLRRNPTVTGLAAAVIVLVGVVVGITVWSSPSNRNVPTAPILGGNQEPDSSADDLLEVVAELDRTDPDWRLEEIEANREAIPDDRNGALQIRAFRQIVADLTGRPRSEGNWQSQDVWERFQALDRQSPTIALTDDVAEAFRAELKRVDAALTQARKFIDYPRGRFLLVPTRDVFSTLLPEHATGRNVVSLLFFDAVVQIHDGNRGEAIKDTQAMFNVARLYNDEPLVIAQLIRMAIFRDVLQTIERMVAQGECTDGELQAFQEELSKAATVPVLDTMARAERGAMHYFLSSLAAGDLPDPEVLRMMGIEDRSQLPSGQEIRRIHAWLLKHNTKLVEIARLPPEQRWEPLHALDEEASSAPLAGTPLVEGLLITPFTDPTLGKQSNGTANATAAARHLAELRCAMTALAVERYRLSHDDWPGDLSALVPVYLKEVPTDPFDGDPLRYRRTSDGVVVYSLGADRTDNQGNLNRTGSERSETDLGFQLWDVAKRRQSPNGGK